MDDTEITADEAAKILGVLGRQVRFYFANGLLPGRRIGARLLVFKRADVEALKGNKPKKTGRPRKEPAPAKPAKPSKKKKK